MKRSVSKISLAILAVVGILLGLLAVLARDSAPKMAFAFLDGMAMTARLEDDPGKATYRTILEEYSFEADFNDVCAKIDAELLAMGSKASLSVRRRDITSIYRLSSISSGKSVVVSIIDGRKFREYSTPKWSNQSSPIGYNYERIDGWVSVGITQIRPRYWPPQYLLRRLQRFWRQPANKPPAQNKNFVVGNKQGS